MTYKLYPPYREGLLLIQNKQANTLLLHITNSTHKKFIRYINKPKLNGRENEICGFCTLRYEKVLKLRIQVERHLLHRR